MVSHELYIEPKHNSWCLKSEEERRLCVREYRYEEGIRAEGGSNRAMKD
jgi:hypothetical protein